MLMIRCRFLLTEPATTAIYTLSLHDALPICRGSSFRSRAQGQCARWQASSNPAVSTSQAWPGTDRKSTRLNSSHEWISYAVFCLKKKNVNFADPGALATKKPIADVTGAHEGR